MKILVVEDERITAEDVRFRLEDMGHTVTAIASSGEESIQKVAETKPDLVLMDIVLKGDIDGIEAAGQIRDRFNIPVVFVTAHGEENIFQRARKTKPVSYILKPLQDVQFSIAIDRVVDRIIERKQAEDKIKASLREKEVLLKEIHHRVKNNLQVISSLVDLQISDSTDAQVLQILKEIQNRIQSMALIHEELHQSEDMARINFGEYIQSLTAYLYQTYGAQLAGITLKSNVDDIFLDIDTAMPCGLIVNELVSNSLKYAFTEELRGEIRIDFHSDTDNHLTLTVSDNGVGFPQDLDFRKTKSLGLRLVVMLTEQLDGTIKLDRSDGTKFEITF